MACFPLVGLLIGLIVALFDRAASNVWPPGIVGALDCICLALLTRGLHLDGLADTADGILSSRPRDQALAIMKDSSTGALGATVLILVIFSKTVSLQELSRQHLIEWMVLAPAISRFSLVALAALSPYARPEGGLGALFVGKGAKKALFVAGPITLASCWFLAGLKGILAFMASCAMAWVAAIWFKNRLGGVTGDCLGAHLELVETIMLLYGAAKGILKG